ASNHRAADLSEKHRAMLDFAVKLTEEPERVTQEDLDELREVGYTEEEVWDIGSVAAFFNLSNRMASMADMRPNEEFHSMAYPQTEE
ncbi:MAG: peroxidase-related enzyme, partial [Halobacteria archaeon]|nr:peroxidase-related enzyme [Halobacteria archaeon]